MSDDLVSRDSDSPLHGSSQQLALEYVRDFAKAIVLQAKALAKSRGDDVVLTSHVEEARHILSRQGVSGADQAWLVIAGALLGTFAQGLIGELLAQNLNPVAIGAYVVIGVFGGAITFWRLLP